MDGDDGRGADDEGSRSDGRDEGVGREREDRPEDDVKRPAGGEPRDDERSAASVATEGEDWRFSMDDLERTNELTPGSPEPESVLFVLLGVAFTVAVLAQFVGGLP